MFNHPPKPPNKLNQENQRNIKKQYTHIHFSLTVTRKIAIYRSYNAFNKSPSKFWK